MPDSISDKVRHVKSATQTRDHTCHWPGCKLQVKPAMWGCARHWAALPTELQHKLWDVYRIGQENDGRPSERYIAVAREIQAWIETRHITGTGRMRPPADDPKAEAGSFDRPPRPQAVKHDPAPQRPSVPAQSSEVQSSLYQLALHFADRKAAVIPMFEAVKEDFSERAAIREHLGGLPRGQAELEAYRDTVEIWNHRLVPAAQR